MTESGSVCPEFRGSGVVMTAVAGALWDRVGHILSATGATCHGGKETAAETNSKGGIKTPTAITI